VLTQSEARLLDFIPKASLSLMEAILVMSADIVPTSSRRKKVDNMIMLYVNETGFTGPFWDTRGSLDRLEGKWK